MRHSRVRPRCCCCPPSRSGDTDSEVTHRPPGAEPCGRPSASRSALAVGASPPPPTPSDRARSGAHPTPPHLANYPWTSPPTRQLPLDIANYPWAGQKLSVPVEGGERLPGLPGVRKVGPDTLTRRCSDQGCNFGARAGLNSAAIPALRALDAADTGSPSQRSPDFATSVARYVQTSQPSPGHDTSICPFRLKVARDCPACLGFAK